MCEEQMFNQYFLSNPGGYTSKFWEAEPTTMQSVTEPSSRLDSGIQKTTQFTCLQLEPPRVPSVP